MAQTLQLLRAMRTIHLLLILVAALCSCGDPSGAGVGEQCAGFQGTQCRSDLFCDFELGGCALADGAGTCQVPPIECTSGGEPVCGCDGERYASECEAHQAGTDDSGNSDCLSVVDGR